jgi:HK97 family phage major capsid protein
MENVKTPAELEIERRDGIAALAETYAKYLGPNDGRDAVRNGMSVEAFKDLIIAKMASRHTDASEINVGMTAKEVRRYSFGRALAAAVTGDWREAGLEREASEAMAKIMGRAAEGFYLPPDVFRRDFNVGTASEAGNLVATDLRSDLYTDVLRNNLVMARLGARVLGGLTGNIDIPRKITAGTIGTVTEIGSASETAPATAKVTLSPKRASAYVEVSKQALLQSGMSLEAMIRDDLLSGVAVHIENQTINGTGTAPQMTGIRYTSSIGTVVGGTNGAAPAWSHVVDLESACANSNAEPDRLSGYLINTKTRGKLKQTQFGTNLPFIWQNGAQPLNGYRAEVTNNMLSNITKGTSTTVCSSAIFGSDWSMATIGLFGAPDITVDPYSKADTGQVKITLNQFADFGVRQPAAFAKIDDLVTG